MCVCWILLLESGKMLDSITPPPLRNESSPDSNVPSPEAGRILCLDSAA